MSQLLRGLTPLEERTIKKKQLLPALKTIATVFYKANEIEASESCEAPAAFIC